VQRKPGQIAIVEDPTSGTNEPGIFAGRHGIAGNSIEADADAKISRAAKAIVPEPNADFQAKP
jgi:hypothetical protein